MNENKEIQTRSTKLEQLTPEQQAWILETALHAHLVDMVEALRSEGINTSPASLSRFIRKDREKRLLEDREESKRAVEELAAGGEDGQLRKGTLEAVRQRLYERALVSQSPEEARELYAAMVKEEARLRELELEARKVAALERQVNLQEVRIQVMAQQAAKSGKGMLKATVAASETVVEGVGPAMAVGQLTAGDGAAVGGDGNDVKHSGDEEKQKLVLLLREMNEIANRGGAPDEKVLELRARLAEEMRLIGSSS